MTDPQKVLFTCATCRWWVPGKKLTSGQSLPGQCHRDPPAATIGGTRWPATDAGEWCGEHHRLHEDVRLTGDDALGRLDRILTETASAPAGQPAEEAGAAVLRTGGAEPAGTGNSAPAEAETPRQIKPAAFARPARRR